MLLPDRFLNVGDQGLQVRRRGPAPVNDEIGMVSGHLGVAHTFPFEAALVNEPAGRRPLGGIFEDAAAGEFFRGKFSPALLNNAAMDGGQFQRRDLVP